MYVNFLTKHFSRKLFKKCFYMNACIDNYPIVSPHPTPLGAMILTISIAHYVMELSYEFELY
jgi:hypothetical protein